MFATSKVASPGFGKATRHSSSSEVEAVAAKRDALREQTVRDRREARKEKNEPAARMNRESAVAPEVGWIQSSEGGAMYSNCTPSVV